MAGNSHLGMARVAGVLYEGTKAQCDAAYKMITPAPGYMRLSVDSNGQCKDIQTIDVEILTKKGVFPLRRNGPVDVTGDYGREDCVLVAINGACGYPLLTRDQLATIQLRLEVFE